MLKLIFDKLIFLIIECGKGEDFKNGALHSNFIFVNIDPHKPKKCVAY